MQDNNYITVKHGEFSVNYLSVGNGDSIFINLPDDKTVLIDTGVNNTRYANYVKSAVLSSKNKRVDYLVITHPDLDHVGNLEFLLENVEIVNAFVPYVENNALYADYASIIEKLKNKNVNLQYAVINKTISSNNYVLKFLTPLYPDSNESAYLDFNMEDYPTEEIKNNLSSIIYLEYLGVRFLFTGDVGTLQEKIVNKLYKSNVYNTVGNIPVTLENIDFLKVANHGGSGSTSQEFLSLVKPKNAIISVGGNNSYSNPSASTVERLIKCNKQINVYRTDIDGAISVSVNANGIVNIVTAKSK